MADKCILLLEGQEDVHVFVSIANHYEIEVKPRVGTSDESSAIRLMGKEGITVLLEAVPVTIKASGLERLGIVVDADLDIAARWQALRDRLIEAKYDRRNVPAGPQVGGTIIQQDDLPTVGIWVMPDNTVPGILEDFIAFLVPQEDQLWEQAARCIDSIPPELRVFSEVRRSKAHLHTWLAWQEEPGKPISQAITHRYLDATAPYAQQLANWMRKLFVEDRDGAWEHD